MLGYVELTEAWNSLLQLQTLRIPNEPDSSDDKCIGHMNVELNLTHLRRPPDHNLISVLTSVQRFGDPSLFAWHNL